MDKPRSSAAPIIVAVLLLLPMLYVGSYLALVQPGHFVTKVVPNGWESRRETYRTGDAICGRIFWPLEQIDRKLRPAAWAAPSWHPPDVEL